MKCIREEWSMMRLTKREIILLIFVHYEVDVHQLKVELMEIDSIFEGEILFFAIVQNRPYGCLSLK